MTAAAGALAGTPRPRDARAPAPGTATAAVLQLAVALKETHNLLHKAKQDAHDARRVVRETGKERAVAVEAEASQRAVIRELTQRAAQLGRDKAELVDERDKLRERIRGLKTSLSRYPDEPRDASTRPPLTLTSDAAVQAGAEHAVTAALVDAVAVGDLLRRHVAGVDEAAAYVASRAAASGESAMAEKANALSVETAAMRAALDAFAGDDAAGLSPTQLLAAAATAAMRAMPSAPLVHTVTPSVVAAAMVTAPPMANPETFDAPVATTAKMSVATDVEGLLPLTLEQGTDAAPVMATARSGPDGADDPVTLAAPRDAATSPGIGERRRTSPSASGRDESAPGGGGETRDTGSDPAPLTTETATETDVSTALFDVDLTAAEERDRLRAELDARAAEAAATIEKSQKWKSRCESLRGELAETMARLEASGAETTALRDELARAKSALAAAEEVRGVGEMPASRARQGGGTRGDAVFARRRGRRRPSRRETRRGSRRRRRAKRVGTRGGGGGGGGEGGGAPSRGTGRTRRRTREDDLVAAIDDSRHARQHAGGSRRVPRGVAPARRGGGARARRARRDRPGREGRDRPGRRRPRDDRPCDAAPATIVPAARKSSADRLRDAEMARLAFERAAALVERVTKAERRLERAAAATAAALEVAERGATRAGRRADEEARAIARKLEETDVAVERASRRADASGTPSTSASRRVRRRGGRT